MTSSFDLNVETNPDVSLGTYRIKVNVPPEKKGEKEMKLIKALSWVCFLAVAVLLISGSPALAGNEPPAGCIDLPDEVWGTVVLICTLQTTENDYAVVRVKQIQGCEVVVEVYTDPAWAAGLP